jgi:hypothetical protein
MRHSFPSALITNKGQCVLLRLDGRIYEFTQSELRTVLGLPAGNPGLGISIDQGRLTFEFDEQTVELSERQLQRRLAKQPTSRP